MVHFLLYLSCQRYKSKAIHNNIPTILSTSIAVFIMSKIQIESNSQLSLSSTTNFGSCIYHVKDTNRKQFTTIRNRNIYIFQLYLSCQRYKSKAIHNMSINPSPSISAVFIMSKIQIESNSQHLSFLFLVGFILCPFRRVVFNVISDSDKFCFVLNDMVVVIWLPGKFNVVFPCVRCYC